MNTTEQLDLSEFPIIETQRLVLRQPVLSDAADIFVFRGDPMVQRYNAEPMVDISEARELIERNRAEYLRQDGILWAVTLKGQDTVIGLVGFSQWSYSNRAMLGYDLALAYWGQGIGSEAAREIIRFGFDRMQLNRIEAATIEDNHESQRMLEKLGFVCEGIRREYSLEDDGEYHGSAMYGLLRSEYDQGA
jgi:ribosomal-protein-alanine N-acetyltransferase